MPVRKRHNRRSDRIDFEITPEIRAAFEAYIASEPIDGGGWKEHWHLHDLLLEAGALKLPYCPPCCFHPQDRGIRWQYLPHAVAIYRHLSQ
ncbi:hypothetical protein F9K87_06180 [Brucella anthropi]|uniref:hypothetical protein n=1 Tax=Brucella anthropi TaxID=529 RepID=UPI00124CE9CE|nr:hypothetical protein [Brucella anthropi]KAB2801018.1 hypothetical protein F9K87_06180 [Brucella anthropi]